MSALPLQLQQPCVAPVEGTLRAGKAQQPAIWLRRTPTGMTRNFR